VVLGVGGATLNELEAGRGTPGAQTSSPQKLGINKNDTIKIMSHWADKRLEKMNMSKE